MAKYTSQYKSLGFYVKGELKRFSNGEYVTSNKDEIAVLDGLRDAKRIDEPKTETKSEASARKPATRKGTASAK